MEEIHKTCPDLIFKTGSAAVKFSAQGQINQAHPVCGPIYINFVKRNIEILAGKNAVIFDFDNVCEQISNNSQKAVLSKRWKHGRKGFLPVCKIVQLHPANLSNEKLTIKDLYNQMASEKRTDSAPVAAYLYLIAINAPSRIDMLLQKKILSSVRKRSFATA